MSFFDKLQKIEKLKSNIEQHGKIAAETLRKINYKFRLDWNYYSNMIEGNSLTMQETRSIMVGNITVDGKPIKDVMEMKGHDDVISEILKIGKSELNLSEKRIKDIHKGIMHEEDVAKQPFIGQWKTEPNYLYNYKKERFDFAAPADVKDEMHKLINWLNTEKEKIARKSKDALHPIQLALHFHIDYVTIHPFYDGNGRTARIFTNLILISYGYPPVYVKDTEKEAYNQYLGEIQTYGGDTELFYDFMAGLLIRSEQMVLDAIEGKVIDEPNDWQKKVKLLKLERDTEHFDSFRSMRLVANAFKYSIFPLLKTLIKELEEIEVLFGRVRLSITHTEGENILKFVDNLGEGLILSRLIVDNKVTFYYKLIGFKRDKLNVFSVTTKLEWVLDEFKFFLDEGFIPKIEKIYDTNYTSEEIQTIVNAVGNHIYLQIETNLSK